MESFDAFRAQFPVTENGVFLNHAAISPIPLSAIRAVDEFLQQVARCGGRFYAEWTENIEDVRRHVAWLLSCQPEELAFTGNTSEGLSAVASGLKWRKGDVVLLPSPEFPANLYPWQNLGFQGVQIKRIPRNIGAFHLEDVEKALVPRTRLVSVSSVDFAAGFLCDLEALGDFCQRKGILFCVDAVQSLGIIPMDVKKYRIHFLSASGHKWLLSPMGCGFLYISKEINHLIHPDRVGWKSVIDEENFQPKAFNLKPNALRFEPGSMNVAGIYALGAAFRLLKKAGLERIRRQILFLNDLFIEGLQERNIAIASSLAPKERSGILSFYVNGNPEALHAFLGERNIFVSVRNDRVRISPHFYNNPDDVDLFFEAFDQFLSARA